MLTVLDITRAQQEYLDSLVFTDDDGVSMSNLYKVRACVRAKENVTWREEEEDEYDTIAQEAHALVVGWQDRYDAPLLRTEGRDGAGGGFAGSDRERACERERKGGRDRHCSCVRGKRRKPLFLCEVGR